MFRSKYMALHKSDVRDRKLVASAFLQVCNPAAAGYGGCPPSFFNLLASMRSDP